MVEILLNDAVRERILPAMISVGCILEIYSSFMLVCMRESFPWPDFAIIPLGLWNGIGTLALITKGPAEIYRISKQRLQKLGLENVNKGRSLRSCRPLRTKFAMNFIDELITLTIQDFCWTQTVSLIILFNSIQV